MKAYGLKYLVAIILVAAALALVEKKDEEFKHQSYYEEVLEELRLIAGEGIPKSKSSFWLSSSAETNHGIVEDYYFAAAELRRRDPSIRLPEFYYQLIEGLRYRYTPPTSSKEGR